MGKKHSTPMRKQRLIVRIIAASAAALLLCGMIVYSLIEVFAGGL